MTAGGAPRWRCRRASPEKRVMPVVPGGFDEHAAQMGIAGFGDARRGPVWRRWSIRTGTRPMKAMTLRRGREAAGVAEFGGDGQGGEIVDAAEAAEALDAGAQRLER